jgi:hypothetical protein
MSTYLLKYEESLTETIEKGGSDEVIDRAIKQYNSFHRSEFDTWLTDAKLACIHCGQPAEKLEINPMDEITCKTHRA